MKKTNEQRNKIPLFPGSVKYVQLKESKLNKIQNHNQTKVTPRYYLLSIYLVSSAQKQVIEINKIL